MVEQRLLELGRINGRFEVEDEEGKVPAELPARPEGSQGSFEEPVSAEEAPALVEAGEDVLPTVNPGGGDVDEGGAEGLEHRLGGYWGTSAAEEVLDHLFHDIIRIRTRGRVGRVVYRSIFIQGWVGVVGVGVVEGGQVGSEDELLGVCLTPS